MILDRMLDRFRGTAITIPPLDGAFRPNNALEDAPVSASLRDVDCLAVAARRLVAAAGNAVWAFPEESALEVVERYDAPVTAFAVSPAGDLAVALENGVLLIAGEPVMLPSEVRCIVALAFGPDGVLWIANGSAHHPPSGWVADLMEKRSAGSLWRRAPGGDIRRIADGLAWPYGLLAENNSVVVAESWRHRLLRVEPSGASTVLLDDLPGYPARLSPASGGGAWLSVFAPRNRLVELVLEEDEYRRDMMAAIPRDHWIAPAFASGNSFLEPLQCGEIKVMGIHKPWAPSRSCGMVVRLDADLRPVFSLQSRSNGRRHGTVSAVEHDGRLYVAARGAGMVLAADLDPEG